MSLRSLHYKEFIKLDAITFNVSTAPSATLPPSWGVKLNSESFAESPQCLCPGAQDVYGINIHLFRPSRRAINSTSSGPEQSATLQLVTHHR